MALKFRSSGYAMQIYLSGSNRLTARTENGIVYPGIANGYYAPVEQYAANVENIQTPIIITKENIDNALAQGWLTQQEHNETIAFISVTPDAPSVENDDIANTVTGIVIGMEYKLDAAEYVAYVDTIFNAIDFSGNHTLLVRVAAEEFNPASADTTLIFTTNLTTPVAPAVSVDDVNNVIVGINGTMEYSLDGATAYTTYNATIPPVLPGAHTVNVRVSAVANISNVSPDTSLNFTTN